ncbi:hypothetical protein PENTCL1PPCAC_23358, partial [Pristionchus entomophagus]
ILRGEQTLPLLQGNDKKVFRHLEAKPSTASFILEKNGRIPDEILMGEESYEVLIECSTQRRPLLNNFLERYRLHNKVSIEESDESVLWSEEKMEEDAEQDTLLPEFCWRVY